MKLFLQDFYLIWPLVTQNVNFYFNRKKLILSVYDRTWKNLFISPSFIFLQQCVLFGICILKLLLSYGGCFLFSPTALEQFLLEASNFELLSDFLSANGLNKLFVFGKRPDARSWIVEDLFITSTLINVKVHRAFYWNCHCNYVWV